MVSLQRSFYIPAELFHSRIAERNPEITTGDVFQFVRLIKNNCAYIGQDAGIWRILSLLFNRQIGEKQVMVDDNDVTFHRSPMHLSDETPIPLAAFLPETCVGPRIQL